jgi:hypothetical protein
MGEDDDRETTERGRREWTFYRRPAGKSSEKEVVPEALGGHIDRAHELIDNGTTKL